MKGHPDLDGDVGNVFLCGLKLNCRDTELKGNQMVCVTC